MKRFIFSYLLVLIILSGFPATPEAAEKKSYIDYSQFQSITTLYKELKNPRLSSITEEGYRLWAKRQMRVPSEDIFFEYDIDKDGRNEALLVVKADNGFFLLVAKQSIENKWGRGTVFQFDKVPHLQRTERGVEIDAESILVWADNEFRLQMGDWEWSKDVQLLDYVSRAEKHQIEIIKIGGWGEFVVKVKTADKDLYSWTTSENGSFLISDDILYRTDFTPLTNGLKLRAYDLKTKREKWNLKLAGIGDVSHSKYRNWGAHLYFMEPKLMKVVGKEVYGTYIEYVDLDAGKTVSSKKFPPPTRK